MNVLLKTMYRVFPTLAVRRARQISEEISFLSRQAVSSRKTIIQLAIIYTKCSLESVGRVDPTRSERMGERADTIVREKQFLVRTDKQLVTLQKELTDILAIRPRSITA